MKSLETRIPPPVILLINIILMWVVSRLIKSPVLIADEFSPAGFLLIAIGVTIFFLSVFRFGKSKTTMNPVNPISASTLVTQGIFSISRNPMYVGMIVVLVGWAVYLKVALPWVMIPLFVVYMTTFQIIPEEKALTEKFGETYLAYKKKVRRWV
jgi:protein-S-isoprenylcysteine O-methyltransferase Ste14